MKGKLILVADDEPEICSELSLFLKKHGFEVIIADNGKKALDLFQLLNPEIVISDYKMPVMNGFELFLNIKRLNKSTRVIIVSALVDFDPFVLTKNSSSFDFLSNPLNLNKLLELINKE